MRNRTLLLTFALAALVAAGSSFGAAQANTVGQTFWAPGTFWTSRPFRASRAFRCVALDVMPAAILKSHGEDIHDGMVEGFPAGFWIEFLWIIRAGANHVVRVVAGMDDDFFDS